MASESNGGDDVELTEYPFVFKFSKYTTDMRLRKFDPILQYLYNKILTDAGEPLIDVSTLSDTEKYRKATYYINIIGNKSKAEIIRLIMESPTKYKKDSSGNDIVSGKEHLVFYLLRKQYGKIDGIMVSTGWPPEDYPDVSHKNEETAELPPLCKVPGIETEATIHAAFRTLRNILDETINPDLKGKTLKEAFDFIHNIPIIETDDSNNNLIRKALGDDTINVGAKFSIWNRVGQTIGSIGLVDIVNSPSRFYDFIKHYSWMDLLTRNTYNTYYTEIEMSLFGSLFNNSDKLLTNRNQQIFIIVPNNEDINTTISVGVDEIPINKFAWIKSNYPFPPPNKPEIDKITRLINFQGYRFMDMPPPPVLKAFAHGPPVDMSSHVKKLFPEWTRPDTLKVWLKAVMDKWLADIIVLRDRLLREVCNPDNTINMHVRHLRDIPTIQYDLYQDVLGYINRVYTGKFTMAGGLRSITKSAIKSKGMVIDRKTLRRGRKQRGGATGMPLAYFQDGAQMRGTYAEPTGVGLAGSTGSMARVGISQTGGRYQNGKQQGGKQSGRHQNGGFAPSIMGQMVVNGSYLMPVASYMGYKMLKGHRGSARHPAGHRGPRSTHKKRRRSRHN